MSATDTQAGANSLRSGPDGRGRFGIFGGRFVAETLMPRLLVLAAADTAPPADPEFRRDLD
ncbi:MAG: tryptophan synthase subunit beta, partial [Komagataeibacter saccharivorans]